MKKRRPFFLLEAVIAIALVSAFAYLSFQSSFQSIGQQRKLLQELEYSRLADLKRMEVVAEFWNQGEEIAKAKEEILVNKGKIEYQVGSSKTVLNSQQKYIVRCQKRENENCYLLAIEEKRAKPFRLQLQKRGQKKEGTIYHFFVQKAARI